MKIIYGEAVTSWSEFLLFYPAHSIALDGYVNGPPEFFMSSDGPFRTFDHHEGVDRTCTVATCEQVRRAILLGLFDAFDQAKTTVYANDCDEDVCLSTWLLKNPHRANEPAVRTLSQIEDLLDSSSGMFPMPHYADLLAKIRWVFEPCFTAKQKKTDAMDTIAQVHRRIEAFITDVNVPHQAFDGSYSMTINAGKWLLTTPKGSMAKAGMVAEGWKAGVEMFDLQNGAYRYTLWRLSEYIHWFPVKKILNRLAQLEPGWGGSDIVGGSPRFIGSKIPPEKLVELIKEVIP